MKNIKCLLIAVFFTSAVVSEAQLDFDLTQRWFNETLYNPASAGNNFSTGVFLHTRQRWVGVTGAPSTHAGTFDTYIEDLRSGFGLTFAVDKLGSNAVNNYSTRLAYAFYIPVGEKAVLSLGMSGGILFSSRRLSLSGSEEPDPSEAYANRSVYSPDFDFGLEFKGPFKLGASIRHLGAQSSTYNLPKHSINIWTYASSRFNLSESLSIEPLASVLFYESSPIVEAGSLVYFFKTERNNAYSDKFWLGALYRSGNSFVVLAGINLTSKIRLGYSFDYAVGDLSPMSKGGSHELFLSFYLNRIFYKDEACPAYRGYRRK
jgi:type IX secretion system PorP/SprF family membrane protein